ncbi:MAG: 3-hydroxyacyl-ACP dehydratase FabZ family protein [Beijerinckiaceae bacterium]
MRLETFEMIDRIASFDRTERHLQAHAKVPAQSPVFEGHFPGYPLVPGVLLTETMAQASGYLVLGLNGVTAMPFLAGVEKAKFRTFVGPQTELVIDAALTHEGSGYAVTKASISVDGKRICDAQLMFRVMPVPAELAPLMRARVQALGLLATDHQEDHL